MLRGSSVMWPRARTKSARCAVLPGGRVCQVAFGFPVDLNFPSCHALSSLLQEECVAASTRDSLAAFGDVDVFEVVEVSQ